MEALDDNDLMPFGKYSSKGDDPRPISEVPASYLLWLYDKDNGLWQDNSDRNMPLRLWIEENYDGLRKDADDFVPVHPYYKP